MNLCFTSKKTLATLMVFAFLSFNCNTLKKIGLIPSEFEMASGLKAALEQGLFKSFDAFANAKQNPLMMLNLPGELDKIDGALNMLGVKTNATQITQKITNAMSQSVIIAKPIFVDAIKKMSIRDAAKILVTNNPKAATDYFKQEATPALMQALIPIVDSNLQIDGVQKEYTQVATLVNAIPFLNKKMESNLSAFVAGRALDIMFAVVAKEEAHIRSKYQLQKTDIIKKVFTYAEKELSKKLKPQNQ